MLPKGSEFVKPDYPIEKLRKKDNRRGETVLKTDSFIVLTGKSNPLLAHKVGDILAQRIHEPITLFADGETRVQIPENLRKRDVMIIQPTSPPVNDSIMELVLMIDAAKRASAREITAVIPYYGYSRQDRKDRPRVPVSSARVAEMIKSAGADRIVTVDIHSRQQQGFFDGPWDNLISSPTLIPKIMELGLPHIVVSTTDSGGVGRAKGFLLGLNAAGFVVVNKDRDITVHNQSKAIGLIGDVMGKIVLITDDIIDTAGSLIHAVELLIENGANQIYVAATHGLFNGNALEKITNSPIKGVFVTDTVQHRKEVLENPKITIVSIAPLLAEAMRRIYTGESLSKDLF